MNNKKAAPVKEQPSNQSSNDTAPETNPQEVATLEAIRRGLFAAGVEHDHWERFADRILGSLKDAGIVKAPQEEAYFILPNGQTTDRLFVGRDGKPILRLVRADEACEPAMSVQGIKNLVRYIDSSADIRTIFHIHGERDRASAEEIAKAIETRLRGHAMTGGHCYHNSTHWFSLDVPGEKVEYIIFYTPEEVSQ